MAISQQFLDAIAATPDDAALRLQFADWLEEQGNPLSHEWRKGMLQILAYLDSNSGENGDGFGYGNGDGVGHGDGYCDFGGGGIGDGYRDSFNNDDDLVYGDGYGGGYRVGDGYRVGFLDGDGYGDGGGFGDGCGDGVAPSFS